MKPVETESPERLCEEILAEGRRQAERLRAEARKAAETLSASAASEAEAFRKACLEAARKEAERRRERLLAGVSIEIARMRAARIEALLDDLRQRALRDLAVRRGFDAREALVDLAAEALARMAGEAFVLGLAPEVFAEYGESRLAALSQAIRERAGRPEVSLALEAEPAITGAGLILRDAEGRQVWDNRLEVRLARLWPALRVPVARIAGLLPGEDAP
ncbi:MAG TPA: V-type ATP synthase subunit E family protein [Holophaga sp.]|nr:V-type ATP synthase subunit E family protein [Holophaga sp.]